MLDLKNTNKSNSELAEIIINLQKVCEDKESKEK